MKTSLKKSVHEMETSLKAVKNGMGLTRTEEDEPKMRQACNIILETQQFHLSTENEQHKKP